MRSDENRVPVRGCPVQWCADLYVLLIKTCPKFPLLCCDYLIAYPCTHTVILVWVPLHRFIMIDEIDLQRYDG